MATLTIAKREFKSYWNSPIAYVVICISLLGLGLVFFNFNGGFFEANRASLALLFERLPRALGYVVIPVITMRLVAEEKRSGTLEMLITLPVKDHQVILGKFLGALGLVVTLVLATAFYPLMMFGVWDLGSLDSGPVLTAYLGLVLYSAAAVSIGLFISSLTESQIIAFFVTTVLLFFLHLFGAQMEIGILPDSVREAAAFISFDSRLSGFIRGMVNMRDVVFFLTITAVCLLGSFWALERRKWS
ncbi:MAG: ABC transporter permease [Myxococcota bacterium]